ncbi:protein arginine N-methyltransferase 2 isoform X2 [Macrotis lagotis]|uniref:protein arginine N-methyltransferase 2 isoform X2 n=1 Tax=Macrotis lagotis TaxID=92651 RepID=UPI003D689EF3
MPHEEGDPRPAPPPPATPREPGPDAARDSPPPRDAPRPAEPKEQNDEDPIKENAEPEEFVAIADYAAMDESQLGFCRGEKLLVLRRVTTDWWWGEREGRCGYVPASYVRESLEEPLPEDTWQDEEYFGSYGTLKLHLEMLSDQPRMAVYHQVILRHKDFLEDKVVLDVGCGTGILSLFCAHYSRPRAVYAVEASEMAQHTQQLVQHNGFADRITIFQQKMEDVALPRMVDVLVSEWMGTCLLFEFMIESVLYARDKWLSPDGVIWPTTAAIHLAPCSAEKDYDHKVLFWDNAYEFDLSSLKSLAIREFFAKPKFNHVLEPEECLSAPHPVFQLDMRTLQIPDLEKMEGELGFCIQRAGTLHGFSAWFSVEFQNLGEDGPQLMLSTGPWDPPTHWKQTLFMLDEPLAVHAGDMVSGSIVLQRNPVWRRHMSITLSWTLTSSQDPSSPKVPERATMAVSSSDVVLAAEEKGSLSPQSLLGPG